MRPLELAFRKSGTDAEGGLATKPLGTPGRGVGVIGGRLPGGGLTTGPK